MFKARMKFAKEGRAKYISHLDLMHAMQRSMARCQMPLWFTEGFNQHAYVSVALPLSTGYSGECEFLDFNITAEAVPENAVEALNDVFPEGLRAIEIYPLADGGMKVGSIECRSTASHGVLRMVQAQGLCRRCAQFVPPPHGRDRQALQARRKDGQYA